MDAVAAIVFTSIAITISVPIVQYFTEVANSDSVCGS